MTKTVEQIAISEHVKMSLQAKLWVNALVSNYVEVVSKLTQVS